MEVSKQKSELRKATLIKPKHLMGTKAFHILSEISREEPDLFLAVKETEKYWVGTWVTGFGFFNVLFPKETSRELSTKEIECYSKKYIQINLQPLTKLKLSVK